MKTHIGEEKNREYIRTGHSSRACPPLYAEREIDALGGGGGVHLSAADRSGVLVAVALLGGGASRRGARIANAASVGRPHLLRGAVPHVRDVAAANQADGRTTTAHATRPPSHHPPQPHTTPPTP